MSYRIIAAALLLLPLTATAQGIRWERDFDKALTRAKEEKKVIFLAINMDGERANDEAVELHYKHKTITALSRHTVNLFASTADHGTRCNRVPGLTCKEHRRIEIKMREKFLNIPPGEQVVAPQHLLISPAGKVLVSCIYQITVGELEWMFVEALKKNDPLFTWKLSDAARAPRRVKFGYERPAPAGPKPPTKEEVEEVLNRYKRGRIDFRRIREDFDTLLRSSEEEAIKYIDNFIHSRWGRPRRYNLIQRIGKLSPKPWNRVILSFLDDQERRVKLATIIALEKLAAPKSLKRLKKSWKSEKDLKLKGRLLRAMAAVKPDDRSTAALILKTATKGDNTQLRINAVLAAGTIADRRTTTRVLVAALNDSAAKLRSTAAYVIAIRRDKMLKVHLQEVLKREKDEQVKKHVEAALKAIDGGKLDPFKDFLTKVAGDEVVKEEAPRWGGQGGPNGGNGGNGGGAGGGAGPGWPGGPGRPGGGGRRR